MGTYRTSRNIERSIIDFLETQLQSEWSNISVFKTFKQVDNFQLDIKTNKACVVVRNSITEHERVELGGYSTRREATILIDIFAPHDGLRLDIKDFIIEKVKGGIPYYNYTIVNGAVDSKVADGRLTILNIGDEPIDFNTPKEELDIKDRYRHLITLTVRTGKVEI